MLFQPAYHPIPLPSARSGPETDVAYFERRLDETTTRAADAAEECSYAAHAGLAELYRLELLLLRNGPVIEISARPLLEQARETGVIKGSVGGAPRPKLSLGWPRDG